MKITIALWTFAIIFQTGACFFWWVIFFDLPNAKPPYAGGPIPSRVTVKDPGGWWRMPAAGDFIIRPSGVLVRDPGGEWRKPLAEDFIIRRDRSERR